MQNKLNTNLIKFLVDETVLQKKKTHENIKKTWELEGFFLTWQQQCVSLAAALLGTQNFVRIYT